LPDRVAIEDRALDELIIARRLDRRDEVEHADALAPLDEQANQVLADEPGSARDKGASSANRHDAGPDGCAGSEQSAAAPHTLRRGGVGRDAVKIASFGISSSNIISQTRGPPLVP